MRVLARRFTSPGYLCAPGMGVASRVKFPLAYSTGQEADQIMVSLLPIPYIYRPFLCLLFVDIQCKLD